MKAKILRFRVSANLLQASFWDLCFLAGLCVFVYGAWLIYHPAAFMLAGASLAAIGFYSGLSQLRPHDPHGDE